MEDHSAGDRRARGPLPGLPKPAALLQAQSRHRDLDVTARAYTIADVVNPAPQVSSDQTSPKHASAPWAKAGKSATTGIQVAVKCGGAQVTGEAAPTSRSSENEAGRALPAAVGDIGATGAAALRLHDDPCDVLYHRDAIARAIDLANRSPGKPSGLDAFSVARLREDFDGAGYVQIRAVQLRDPEGLEFRFNLRAVGDIEIDAEAYAAQVLDAADQFERMIGAIPTDELRAVVDAAIAPAVELSSPMRVRAVGLSPTATTRHYAITVDVETLGDDLNDDLARVVGWDHAEVRSELAELAVKHAQRDALRCGASACHAIGWIDGAALRVLEASGLTLVDAVRMLKSKRRIEFDFETPDTRSFSASLYWVEGVIKADLQSVDSDWSFTADNLSIRHPQQPETLITAWVGRRIGEIIEQDFIPPDAVIESVADVPGGWLEIGLAIAAQPVDQHIDQADRSWLLR